MKFDFPLLLNCWEEIDLNIHYQKVKIRGISDYYFYKRVVQDLYSSYYEGELK